MKFLAKVMMWSRVFLVFNLGLCLLSFAALVASAVDVSLVGLNAGAPPVLTCSTLLFVLTLLGLISLCRLKSDLAQDEATLTDV